MSFSSDIDYLFEDASTPSPPKTQIPFEKLPAELRNKIYGHYFENAFTHKDQQEGQIIKLNARGEVIFPPLTSVSRQMRAETEGYTIQALFKPSTKIEAQVLNSDPAPLMRGLREICAAEKVPASELFSKVKVSMVGQLNNQNLINWIVSHVKDPASMPIFAHDKARLDGYGEFSLFEGRLSIKSFMQLFERSEALSKDNVAWRKLALSFLDNAEAAGMDIPRKVNKGGNKLLATEVWKVIVAIHDKVA